MRFLPSSWVRFLSLRDDAMPASLLAAFWPSSAAVRNTRSKNDLAVMPSSRGPIIRPFQSIVARRANEASTCCESGQGFPMRAGSMRSEEHTSELQSRLHLVCRLLLEKKKMRMSQIDLSAGGRYVVVASSDEALAVPR